MTVSPQDAQMMLTRARRALAEAPAQLADGLARVVRDTSDDQLDRLMRTPMRRAVLEAIFWQMPRVVDRQRAGTVRCSVRWCITGRLDGGHDSYHLEIVEGSCRVVRGESSLEPRLTIKVDGAEFVRLATGNSDPMRAYLTGRVTLAGDVMFAVRLGSLLRVPGSSRPQR